MKLISVGSSTQYYLICICLIRSEYGLPFDASLMVDCCLNMLQTGVQDSAAKRKNNKLVALAVFRQVSYSVIISVNIKSECTAKRVSIYVRITVFYFIAYSLGSPGLFEAYSNIPGWTVILSSIEKRQQSVDSVFWCLRLIQICDCRVADYLHWVLRQWSRVTVKQVEMVEGDLVGNLGQILQSVRIVVLQSQLS